MYTVDAPFIFKAAESPLTLYFQDYFFDTADGGFVNIYDFRFPALDLGVMAVHTEEVGGKESGFVTAGAGPYLHDDIPSVFGVFGQQRKLKLLQQAFQLRLKVFYLLLNHNRHFVVHLFIQHGFGFFKRIGCIFIATIKADQVFKAGPFLRQLL